MQICQTAKLHKTYDKQTNKTNGDQVKQFYTLWDNIKITFDFFANPLKQIENEPILKIKVCLPDYR